MSATAPPEKNHPFAALIGVSSLLAALLYVAGFAYRWSYYYNFGVQHLVFKLGVQSFLITALELVVTPRALGLVLLQVVAPVLLLNGVLASLAGDGASPRRSVRLAVGATRRLGLNSPLVVDLLRAGWIIFATYRLASMIGYETFLLHARHDPHHPLPAVTAVLAPGKDGPSLAFACGAAPDRNLPFIGDGVRLEQLQTMLRTCNRDALSWRLLYRDDEEIYLFAAEGAETATLRRRPLTLVLPNRGNIALAME